MSRKLVAILVLFLLFFVFSFSKVTTSFGKQREPEKDRYIVVLKNYSKGAFVVSQDLANLHKIKINKVYSRVLNGFAATISADKLSKIKEDKRVLYVVEDKVVSIEAKGGKPRPTKPPRSTPTPTQVPTSTPTPTYTPTPTNIPTPTPTLSVMVTSPNGGEVLTVGQTYRITWNTSSNIDMVTIGYKACDSCLDWIAYNIPNQNYFDWTVYTVYVGNTINTQYKIYVIGYHTGYGSVSDTSDANFTVLQLTPTPTTIPTITPTKTPSPTPTPFAQNTPLGVKRIGENTTNKGEGITVAVIDTGIDLTHPDLAGNIVANVSCIDNLPTGNDDHGHGSHVAGTIAAIDNTIGVKGVAPDVNLVAVKVLDSGGWGYWSEIICGIDWVTTHASQYNIKVANMSLGGGGTSDNNCGNTNNDPMHQAICNSTAAGVTYVVSAGNYAEDASASVPAAYDDTVITVSALTDSNGQPGGSGPNTSYGPDDTFASFSNFGSVVDIGAPGTSIYSTYRNGGYTYMSGTSMSSPHVSGTAALYIHNNPGATYSQVRSALISTGESLNSGHTDPSGLHPEPVVRSGSF